MKKAFITGITGQDGSYLAELLLSKDYEVHGLVRRASTFNTGRLDCIYQDPHIEDARLKLHYGDMADGTVLCSSRSANASSSNSPAACRSLMCSAASRRNSMQG